LLTKEKTDTYNLNKKYMQMELLEEKIVIKEKNWRFAMDGIPAEPNIIFAD
jgi:hypothetical protein